MEMEIQILNKFSLEGGSRTLVYKHGELNRVLSLLRTRELPADVATRINQEIHSVDANTGRGKELLKSIK